MKFWSGEGKEGRGGEERRGEKGRGGYQMGSPLSWGSYISTLDLSIPVIPHATITCFVSKNILSPSSRLPPSASSLLLLL
jgi:hypothetical protein